jgi:dolichyl-diphosphooligosaccharide---protein glycosyltransferase subunit 2 (ribophorin II)
MVSRLLSQPSLVSPAATTTSLKSAAFGLSVLADLDSLAKLTTHKNLCTSVTAILSDTSVSTTVQVSALRVAALAKCSGFKVSQATKDMLQSQLESDSASSIYDATMAIFALVDANAVKTNEFVFTGAVDTLAGLSDSSSGLCVSRTGAKRGSAINAGKVMEALGHIFRRVSDIQDRIGAKVRAVAKTVTPLLSKCTQGSSFGFRSKADTVVSSVGHVVRGVSALYAALSEELDVSAAFASGLGEYAVKNKQSSVPEHISHVLSAVGLLSSDDVASPIALTASASSDSARVTNVLGNKISDASVSIKQVKDQSGKVVASDVRVSGSGPKFTLGLDKLDVQVGQYEVELTASAKVGGKKVSSSNTISYTKFGTLSAKSVRIVAAASKDTSASSGGSRASFPNKITGTVDATKAQYLLVTVELDGTAPAHQVFVQFRASTGVTSSFVAVKSSGNTYVAKINLGLTDTANALAAGAGTYQITVIAGSSFASQGVTWPCGSIELNIASPTYSPNRFQPLPEQHHTFGAPSKRPFRIISMIFSGVVLLPLFVLLWGFAHVGLSLQLPKSVGQGFYALGFHSSIAAILLLYVVYWLGLSIFHAMIGMAILGPVALFFGNRALHGHYEQRQSE